MKIFKVLNKAYRCCLKLPYLSSFVKARKCAKDYGTCPSKLMFWLSCPIPFIKFYYYSFKYNYRYIDTGKRLK